MRELIIEARLGLCNRLRAAITGTMLGEKYGRQVYLVWKVEPTCGARWSELFTNPVQEKASLPDELRYFDGSDVEAISRAVQSDQPVVSVSTSGWLREGNDWNIMLAKFRALQPVPAVQQKIDALLAQFTAPTMGVPSGVIGRNPVQKVPAPANAAPGKRSPRHSSSVCLRCGFSR